MWQSHIPHYLFLRLTWRQVLLICRLIYFLGTPVSRNINPCKSKPIFFPQQHERHFPKCEGCVLLTSTLIFYLFCNMLYIRLLQMSEHKFGCPRHPIKVSFYVVLGRFGVPVSKSGKNRERERGDAYDANDVTYLIVLNSPTGT